VDAYSETVLDHFQNPRNAGVMDEPDGVGYETNPVCGDTMRLMLRISDDRIEDARWQTKGCPAAIATSSFTSELIRGMSLDDATALTREEITRRIGGLPRSKMHCSVLAQDAIRKAVADYRTRAATEAAPKGPNDDSTD
jgi:nitrogen fixation protein NifU and related proteins